MKRTVWRPIGPIASLLAIGLSTLAAAPARAGVDIALGEFYSFFPRGYVPPYLGYSVTTVSCNVGDTAADWHAPMDPRHPFIAYAMYRVENGRIEQIGLSWVKHGFAALRESHCATCTAPSDPTILPPNCSDTYSVFANSNRSYLGPRTEVNPWTGDWQPCGSYFDNAWGTPDDCSNAGTLPPFQPYQHVLKLLDSDLDQDVHSTAIYYTEGMYLVKNDVDRSNNIGWRRMGITETGSPSQPFSGTDENPDGTPMTQDHAGRTPQYGPAINVWSTNRVTLNASESAIAADGEVVVASQATDLGGGTWHYEYAAFNYNFDHEVASLSVPIAACAVVSNVGFRDFEYSQPVGGAAVADDVNGTDWTASVGGGAIAWTDTSSVNPLRWGQLFNFWFDANVPPGSSTVTITTAQPSVPDSLSGALLGPTPAYAPGDVNGDAVVNPDDVPPFVDILLSGAGNPSATCAADVNGSGGVDGDDVQGFVGLLP